jgi:hypothetical protein
MGGICGRHDIYQKCIENLVGKNEGKIPLGRFKNRWKDTIKVNLKKWCMKR